MNDSTCPYCKRVIIIAENYWILTEGRLYHRDCFRRKSEEVRDAKAKQNLP